MPRGRHSLTFGIVFVSLLVLDQLTKYWVRNTFALYESRPFIGDWLFLTYSRNTGVAFGFGKNFAMVWTFFSVFFLIAVSLWWSRNQKSSSLTQTVAVACLLAGASGNLTDRWMHGYVIDFFDLRWWPIFNIADSAITIGAGLILLAEATRKHRIARS